MDQPLREQAEQLVERAEREADRALVEAVALADRSDADATAKAIALRAAGIAAREMGHLDRARVLFDRSIETAAACPTADVARGRALICRAGLAAVAGASAEALADLEAASALLSGPEAAHVAIQRAAVTHQAGDLEMAQPLYDRALRLARRHGLHLEAARVLSNRGLLWIDRARYRSAARDLRAAAAIYQQHDHPDQLLFVEHNLGYLALCRGNLPEALGYFESVRAAAVASGTDPIKATIDRSHALLTAGLTADAERDSAAAAVHYASRGSSPQAADAYLVAGRAALAARAPDRASDHLRRALELLPGDSRRVWSAVATSLLVAATVDSPGATPSTLRDDMASAIAVLDLQSMHRYGAQARLVDLRLRLDLGDLDGADRRRGEVADHQAKLPPDVRAEYWRANGEIALQRGDRAGALRAFARGLDWNRRMRRTLPWVETATSPGPIGAALAEIGLRTTLQGRHRPESVLRWIESAYESTSLEPAVEPSARAELDQAQAEVRMAAVEVEDLLRRDTNANALRVAEQRLRRAEHRVTRLSRLPTDSRPGASPTIRPVRGLLAELGSYDLLEIASVDGRFCAVSAVDGRLRVHDLGPVEPIVAEVALVRSRLRRSWSSGRVDDGLVAPLARLGPRLIPEPVRRSDRRLVVVCGSELDALPAGALPELRDRPLSTAPSLRRFVEARPRRPPAHDALFVAGPDLPAAGHEIRRAAAFHRAPVVLEGAEATVGNVIGRLDAAVAHLACHGSVRHDSPMFSSLRLGDGPLPIHALQHAGALPRTVILSACDVGRPADTGSPHVLGLPAGLLTLGAEAVVASSVAVPDEITSEVMVELHRQLTAGAALPEALAELRMSDDPLRALVAAAFSCHATRSGLGALA